MIVAIILILLIIIIICIYKNPNKENFTYYGYYKQYCPSCNWRNRISCSKCTNCGYCINESGEGECVQGDNNGPYFRKDCKYWEYGDPYYSYPDSNVYPMISINTSHPDVKYKYDIRKPNRWRENEIVNIKDIN